MNKHEQGAAVITAMFIVVLSTLIISPLIWTLYATSKSVQVFSSRAQAQQVLLSGIDWARVILREDAKSSTTDHLNEIWAVPLADTTLSEGILRQGESQIQDQEASLKGQVTDAQAKFNLRNLGDDVSNQEQWLEAFTRLCTLLTVPREEKKKIELILSEMYPEPKNSDLNDPNDLSSSTSELDNPEAQNAKITPHTWREFYKQFDISEQTWQKLNSHVNLLPNVSTVNINTANTEVIFSVLLGITIGQVQGIIDTRERVTFNNLNDIRSIVSPAVILNENLADVRTSYFIIDGEARINDAQISSRALLERNNNRVFIVWRKG